MSQDANMAFTEPVLTKRIPLEAQKRKVFWYDDYVATGGYDGLRFAIHGGELAAAAALDALAHGWSGVHMRLTATRARAFAGKWRFNRALRALVASPRAVDAAAYGARVAPSVLRAVIARAGDCDCA